MLKVARHHVATSFLRGNALALNVSMFTNSKGRIERSNVSDPDLDL